MGEVTKNTRHGVLTFLPQDLYVGRSLDLYAEYSQGEAHLFAQILRPGDIVVEAGANVGALTVALAGMVGPEGRVIAFEPQPQNADLARRNLRANGHVNTAVIEAALGEADGITRIPSLAELGHRNFGAVETGKGTIEVPVRRLDDLGIQRLDLLKIDVEGDELKVLKGAAETIARCRPLIYCENDRFDRAAALVAWLTDAGYRPYWHQVPLYNPDNFAKNANNVFGNTVSINMVCVRGEGGFTVGQMDEVSDLRIDDMIYEREIARYSGYLRHDPKDIRARVVLAHNLSLMQRSDEAMQTVAENLAIDPGHVPSRTIRGYLRLQRGDYAGGWPDYELRFAGGRNTQRYGDRPHHGEKWDGRRSDRPVLIWCEQGFGDSIMFARFIAQARRRAPHLIVEVQPQLYELFEHARIAPGRLYRQGRRLPDYAFHCAMPSLPAVLGIGNDVASPPYLTAEPALVASWKARWHPRIGICCKGSPKSERPYSRDIPGRFLENIVARYGALALDQQGQFESFMETAAALADLDLVITVDTAVAHLAGAMGVPVWLLLSFDPDWRWGLKAATTPWYGSMRIFRQPKMWDWGSVIAEVEAAIDGVRPPSLPAAPENLRERQFRVDAQFAHRVTQ